VDYLGPDGTPPWAGVRLDALIALAEPESDATWILIGAGPYTVAAPIETAHRIVLCDDLRGEPIHTEAGGPWRLWFADRSYNMGVKWVDRIELCREEPDHSAERLADARERARQFHRTQQQSG
jgi:DMSO/TMAO reductase YedYZ molybdopterin-dependent catalytic subunit